VFKFNYFFLNITIVVLDIIDIMHLKFVWWKLVWIQHCPRNGNS